MDAEGPEQKSRVPGREPLEADVWARAVKNSSAGKRVHKRLYLHRSAVPPDLDAAVARAADLAGVLENDFNVVRFDSEAEILSLLNYPGFFSEGFPVLRESWRVDLRTSVVAPRRYSPATAPVLHRKEQLLRSEHPRREEFVLLTEQAEEIGLFRDPSIIGSRGAWEEELRALGVRVVGNRLLPIEAGSDESPTVERHRTALRRTRLSTPMAALWRHGFLDGSRSVLDYGCGHGDDLVLLSSKGVEAQGWDPYYRPDGARDVSAVVNLGFVLNVIEDPSERREALRGAFSLTTHVLAVAALVGGRTAYERHRLYRDGVLTSRNTFQKYFTHAELGEYITTSLGREPVSIAPGLYFVFVNDEAEQGFLELRQRSPRPPKAQPRRERRTPQRRVSASKAAWEAHSESLERLWQRWLQLGRFPHEDEFPELTKLISALGSARTLARKLRAEYEDDELLAAEEHRRADLLVYLALSLFERRKSFHSLPITVRRDIKTLWGSHKAAMKSASAFLMSLGDQELVEAACIRASESGFGYLEPDRWIQFESALLVRMPPLVRLVAGCAGRLVGEVEEADLVRIDLTRPRVSLFICDDFCEQLIPSVIERMEIDLRAATVRVHSPDPPPPLIFKSRYLHEGSAGYAEQQRLDTVLANAGLVDGPGSPRPTWAAIESALG